MVAFDAQHGWPLPAQDVLREVLDHPWITLLLSWLVMALQLVVAGCVLGSRNARMLALTIIVVFHVGIASMLALPVFSLVMIGIGLAAYGGRTVEIGVTPSLPKLVKRWRSS